ncbi:MAG: nucleoside triphosphate pyrophosphohydrolase [Desulfovibrio sp.]|nr:MAG: nucleoside triphosphate pyrophosphohydrolase [Desulfovibrio sp.]
MSLQSLLDVLDRLLGPDGCPWDKEQTPESLGDYILEEAYELVDAIRSQDIAETRGELGDLFFLLLFVAKLHADQGHFSLDEALAGSAAKMIRRHPHVFSNTEISTQDQLLSNWEKIKKQEKQANGASEAESGPFSSLPKGLPPMLKAYRIHSKAARFGFTWESDADLETQLNDEWREFTEARQSGNKERMEQEFGDYLFTLIELGRRLGFKANAALNMTNLTFLARFNHMEQLARERSLDLAEQDLETLNKLWDEAKKNVNG